MDSRSSLIPICLILTSGASLRASLESVRSLERGVPRNSSRLLASVPPDVFIDDDDDVVVSDDVVAR